MREELWGKEYLFSRGVDEVCGFAWESAGFCTFALFLWF
jgi:hypothetical protein